MFPNGKMPDFALEKKELRKEKKSCLVVVASIVIAIAAAIVWGWGRVSGEVVIEYGPMSNDMLVRK